MKHTPPTASAGAGLKEVAVYADESCLGNGREGSNPGGAAGVIEYVGPSGRLSRHDYWVSERATTNNRMALRSAIEALRGLSRKGSRFRERLSLVGNPNVKEDWYVNPKTGEQIDFCYFARTEGRFAKHFDKEGKPSATLLSSQQERLENWRLLQDLAGIK